jgi:hypothetical protein
MTVTYNEEDDQFSLTSDNLADFDAIESVELIVTLTCDTEYEVEIIEDDVVEGVYTLDNEVVFDTDELEEGVYQFKLLITDTEGNVTQELYCYFLNKTLRCNITEVVAAATILDLEMDYYILSNASGCLCECTNLCAIYKRIIEYESDACSDCKGCQ